MNLEDSHLVEVGTLNFEWPFIEQFANFNKNFSSTIWTINCVWPAKRIPSGFLQGAIRLKMMNWCCGTLDDEWNSLNLHPEPGCTFEEERERESIGHWWRRGKGRYDKWRLASIFPLEAVGERQSLQILKFKLQSESEEAAAFIRIAHWQCLGRRLSSSRTTLQRRLIRWWRTMINKGMKLIKLKWITIINN